jgi:hypothetical protein
MSFSERAALNWLVTNSTRAWVDKNRYGWMRDMRKVAGGCDTDVFHWNVREDDSERYIVHQVMQGVGCWYVDIHTVKRRLDELRAEDSDENQLWQTVALIREQYGLAEHGQTLNLVRRGMELRAQGKRTGDLIDMATLLHALHLAMTRANELASMGGLREQLRNIATKLDEVGS